MFISKKSRNFAAIGVAGYIAPRHLKAIRDTGNKLIAAVDPNDSVGILDQFFPDVRFFTEIERFDRHLEKLRRRSEEDRVHYVSVMTPNYLHDAHCRLALRVGANVICEKPLVINPWNLDQLAVIEEESEGKINTVFQLRVHPTLSALKYKLDQETTKKEHEVLLTYITSRGPWYHVSWKGSLEKSGGIATNIGIHFFDLLQWLFGEADVVKVYEAQPNRMSGFLELKRANVRWYLSVDEKDLPYPVDAGQPKTYRSIKVDGEEIEFSGGFTDLHTKVYEKVLMGEGFGIEDARPSIELTYRIRNTPLVPIDESAHPILLG
ncbi:oxidoreductase [bacterium SM23_57]|jgi:UDP-N-acetyl-2-amino-2-deoxyglucuronate dehydrogenase|nr:MAG: oxidoreductase [bacterium SM23_57]